VPRYFFHTHTSSGQLTWDATGLELPEIESPEDPELAFAFWSEAFDKHLRMSVVLVIMDEAGKVVFARKF
jgi:hypothetical protein